MHILVQKALKPKHTPCNQNALGITVNKKCLRQWDWYSSEKQLHCCEVRKVDDDDDDDDNKLLFSLNHPDSGSGTHPTSLVRKGEVLSRRRSCRVPKLTAHFLHLVSKFRMRDAYPSFPYANSWRKLDHYFTVNNNNNNNTQKEHRMERSVIQYLALITNLLEEFDFDSCVTN